MKKVLLILAAVAIFQKWDDIQLILAPGPNPAVAQNEEVILYATAWCGYCRKAREFMAEHNIAYREFDIETSAEGRRQYDALKGRGVPLMVVKGQIIRGYNPSKILRLTQAAADT